MRSRRFSSKLSHDRWLVSYADFITLLFAFFVVLYAFSKADQKKSSEVSVAIQTGLQSLSLTNTAKIPQGTKAAVQPSTPEHQMETGDISTPSLRTIGRDLQQRLAPEISRGTIAIEFSRDGLVISLREAGFFGSGSARPRSETMPVLFKIADALQKTTYDVHIEGHTDNIPVHNHMFDSNWELSSARAVVITRMFLQLHSIEPQRLSASGFGQYQPIADNETAEGRAKNRRVDVVVTANGALNLPLSGTKDRTGWRRITDQ